MIRSLLTNKYFYLLSLGVILIGALGLLVFDKVLMPQYTLYNQGITVPDLTRVSLKEAAETIRLLGLRYEVSDRRSNAAFPANYVLDQAPGANTIVKPNRKVYLTVNAAVRPTVIVPNVTSLSLRNAQVQLQNYGLVVGTISYESSRFKNVVLQQSLTAGEAVDKGAVINLIVSDGLGDKMVVVPEIVGLLLPNAQLKLREVGLRVGEIRFQPTEGRIPNTVLDFSPKVSELVEGESLNLIVSERFNAVEENEGGAVFTDSTNVEKNLQNNEN
ncbi:MAG: PASTA domain-containing protein [Balneola sp.]|nr:PASTA domain-containing protein [Balneola sp.]|tara:strand:+ start:1246 stop:2064 length:819 start_codon:yes stop_codon:yes gene_type:complete